MTRRYLDIPLFLAHEHFAEFGGLGVMIELGMFLDP